jgi:hypothetical protein
METAPQPEQVSEAGLAAFAERADDGTPVAMLNLLAFEPEGGKERYMEYGAAVAPLLEKAGGRIVFAGAAERTAGTSSPWSSTRAGVPSWT